MPKHDKPLPPEVRGLADLRLLAKINGRDPDDFNSFVGMRLTMKIRKNDSE